MWEIRRSGNRGIKNKGLRKDQRRIGKTKNVWPKQRENLGFIREGTWGNLGDLKSRIWKSRKNFVSQEEAVGRRGGS